MTRHPLLALLFFCLTLGAGSTALAAAGDAEYEKGLALWQADKRSTAALPHWLKAAEQGHAKAAYGVALMHNNYKDADMKIAARWFRVAADGGIAPAMHSLGIFYMKGLGGLTANEATAVQWFRKAAEADDTEAMVMLATLHDEGRGVPKDPGTALRLHLAAAEAGHPIALTTIGLAMLQGTYGVRIDPPRAQLLLNDAAIQGSVDAMRILAKLYQQGFGAVPADPAKAAEWTQRAAACGNTVICMPR